MRQPKKCEGCPYFFTLNNMVRSRVIWHHKCRLGLKPSKCTVSCKRVHKDMYEAMNEVIIKSLGF